MRTKDSARADPYKINDTVAFIDDLFITKDNVYIGVASVFKDTKKVRFLNILFDDFDFFAASKIYGLGFVKLVPAT